jgi:hypothetical protein
VSVVPLSFADRARRLPVLLLALAGALCVGGCASSVGLQKDGSYVLEASEQQMDCQRLSNGIWGRLQIMKALPERARSERAEAAATASALFGRMFSPNKGLQALIDYDRERAHVRSLHQTSTSKGCPPIDVERELAATDAAIGEYRK